MPNENQSSNLNQDQDSPATNGNPLDKSPSNNEITNIASPSPVDSVNAQQKAASAATESPGAENISGNLAETLGSAGPGSDNQGGEEVETGEPAKEESKYEEVKPQKEKRKSRGVSKMKFFDGLNLIVIGLLLLANSLGIVGWGVWWKMVMLFLRFWPVFIILWGISLVLRFSFVTRFLGKILGFLVFLLFICTAVYWEEQDKADDWLGTKVPLFHDYIVSKDLVEKDIVLDENDFDQDFEERNLNFKLTAGELNIKTDDESTSYLELEAEYFEKFGEPKIKERIDGDTLELSFDPYFKPNFFNVFNRKLKYDFKIGELDLPTNIDIEMKAGKSDLEFEELDLGEFKSKLQAGSLDVVFTKDSLPEKIDIELQAGSYNITLPKDVRLNVDYDVTAGSLDIKNENIGWGDGEYTYNEDGLYDIDVKVDIKAGSVDFKFE